MNKTVRKVAKVLGMAFAWLFLVAVIEVIVGNRFPIDTATTDYEKIRAVCKEKHGDDSERISGCQDLLILELRDKKDKAGSDRSVVIFVSVPLVYLAYKKYKVYKKKREADRD